MYDVFKRDHMEGSGFTFDLNSLVPLEFGPRESHVCYCSSQSVDVSCPRSSADFVKTPTTISRNVRSIARQSRKEKPCLPLRESVVKGGNSELPTMLTLTLTMSCLNIHIYI